MAPRDNSPTIQFTDAPNLADPHIYSHAVSINQSQRLIFTSGQIGQRKDGTFGCDFSEQVEIAFDNVRAVLKAADASVREIVKVTFYTVDWTPEHGDSLVESFTKLLADQYGNAHRPLITLVSVARLASPEAKFEVEVVAAASGTTSPYTNRTQSNAHVLPPTVVDVVVVGGGFSGAQAANACEKAGLRTILLEAKHRIGGRSRSQKLCSKNSVVELGATWINKTTQPHVYALAQKFGLQCVAQYDLGDAILQLGDGTVLRVTDPSFVQVS